jgi:hypothetical protein
MDEPVDAAASAHHLAARQMLVREGARIARLHGLCCGEVAILTLGHGEEAVPVEGSLVRGDKLDVQRLTSGILRYKPEGGSKHGQEEDSQENAIEP